MRGKRDKKSASIYICVCAEKVTSYRGGLRYSRESGRGSLRAHYIVYTKVREREQHFPLLMLQDKLSRASFTIHSHLTLSLSLSRSGQPGALKSTSLMWLSS